MGFSRARAALVLVALAACGGHETERPDAAADTGVSPDGGDADAGRGADAPWQLPFTVAQPDIPWLEDGEPPIEAPRLTPCPEGWYETELAGETVCEPWPAGAAEDCPAGQAHLLGSTGCAPLGGPCPPGDFADPLPDGRPLIYVLESAAPDGDGSLATPFATLGEAFGTNPAAGTVLALGRGTYAGGVVPPGLTLVGACAAETVVTAPPDAPYALEVRGGSLELRRLRIEPGPAKGALGDGPGAMLTLRAMEIRNATCRGVEVKNEAIVDAEEVAVDGTRPCTEPGQRSAGLVALGGTLHARRVLSAHNGQTALAVVVTPDSDTTAELVLEDAVIRDQRDTREPSYAVYIETKPDTTAPVTATIRRVLMEDNLVGGIITDGERATADIDGLLARRNGSPAALTPEYGAPSVVVEEGTLHLRRSAVTDVISRRQWGAVHAFRAQRVTLEDTVITENKSVGFLAVQSGSDTEPIAVRRVRVEANADNDISLLESPALELEDARLGDGQGPDTFEGGGVFSPLAVEDFNIEGRLEARRVSIRRGVDSGLRLIGGDLSATLEDVAIVDTQPISGTGHGILGSDGARVTAHRVLLDRNHMGGIEFTNGPGTLVLEDAIVRNTEAFPGYEVGGRGVVLPAGSTALLRRTRIEGTHELGVVTFDSTVTLEDVEVRRTEEASCAGQGLCFEHGHALGVYSGATFEATRFILADAATCGIHFARGSEVDLTDGLITRTRIGGCVQVDGYDLTRLQNQVYYIDNGRNLDATELPVPDIGM